MNAVRIFVDGVEVSEFPTGNLEAKGYSHKMHREPDGSETWTFWRPKATRGRVYRTRARSSDDAPNLETWLHRTSATLRKLQTETSDQWEHKAIDTALRRIGEAVALLAKEQVNPDTALRLGVLIGQDVARINSSSTLGPVIAGKRRSNKALPKAQRKGVQARQVKVDEKADQVRAAIAALRTQGHRAVPKNIADESEIPESTVRRLLKQHQIRHD